MTQWFDLWPLTQRTLGSNPRTHLWFFSTSVFITFKKIAKLHLKYTKSFTNWVTPFVQLCKVLYPHWARVGSTTQAHNVMRGGMGPGLHLVVSRMELCRLSKRYQYHGVEARSRKPIFQIKLLYQLTGGCHPGNENRNVFCKTFLRETISFTNYRESSGFVLELEWGHGC